MRISELSAAADVPIPTIKFYLREGLLLPGRRRATNLADYDQSHVRRLRLIRALVEVGDLPLSSVGRVIGAVEDPSLSMHDALGVALRAIAPTPPADDDPSVAEARAEIDDFLAGLGWQVSADAPGRGQLAVALATLRRMEWPSAEPNLFLRYARVAEQLAVWEVQRTTPAESTRAEIVERVVVGAVVFDAVVSALRRLAQEHRSALRFGAATSERAVLSAKPERT
jgi:DNA-binding transcriptional MerR regulator